MARTPRRSWSVEFVPEAESWLKRLRPEDANRIAGALGELERVGPALGRPYVDSIKRSRHHNMKELRPLGGNLRALFAFDPRRRAVILVGGDKTNDWKGWYRRNVRLADERYDRHLRSLGTEDSWRSPTRESGRRSEGRSR
jgi:hypothetical protein